MCPFCPDFTIPACIEVLNLQPDTGSDSYINFPVTAQFQDNTDVYRIDAAFNEFGVCQIDINQLPLGTLNQYHVPLILKLFDVAGEPVRLRPQSSADNKVIPAVYCLELQCQRYDSTTSNPAPTSFTLIY